MATFCALTAMDRVSEGRGGREGGGGGGDVSNAKYCTHPPSLPPSLPPFLVHMSKERSHEAHFAFVREELDHPGCVAIKEPVQNAFLM